MKQRLIVASKDGLRNLVSFHSKAVESQNTVRESYCGRFVSLV